MLTEIKNKGFRTDSMCKLLSGCVNAVGTTCTDTVALQVAFIYDEFGRRLSQTDALSRSWSFQYDIYGNLTQSTDPKSQVSGNLPQQKLPKP